MRIFDLLGWLNQSVIPVHSKVHLATSSGNEDPLNVFEREGFCEWQRWQTKKNFERQYVVSFIKWSQADQWLFAGVYRCHGRTRRRYDDDGKLYHYYDLVEDRSCGELTGRLVAKFSRSGRQSYLNAENWTDEITLAEILAEPHTVEDFQGYRAVNLSREKLELIFKLSLDSWRTALSSVAGIYLISDTASGKLYVGKASGEGGFWQRWQDYVLTGHGGNEELRDLIRKEGQQRLKSFRYSILEIADHYESEKNINSRENHWKEVLLSRRPHGLNVN